METMHHMTFEQLRAAAAAGGVLGVTLKGQGGAFLLHIATRSGQEAVLSKVRSTEPRRFGNPVSAMVLLREVGIAVAQLDATDWNPDEKDMSRSRASQAEALRHAHQAVAHNRWLAAEIQASLDDPRPSIPQDEAMAAMEAEIDAVESQRAEPKRARPAGGG
jgi:hypothetical protein